MMNPAVKFGLGALALGGASGLGYAGIKYLNNNEEPLVTKKEETKISALIEEGFKYKLLDTKANDATTLEFWKRNWTSYNKDNAEIEKDKDPFKLASWTNENSADLTAELKDACEKAALKTANDKTDPVYKNLEKYCTRGVTVKEDAEIKKKEVLKTEGSDVPTSIWDKRHQEKAALKDSLSKLGINSIGVETTADTIKKSCASAITKNKKDEKNYEEVYVAYEKVCTKQEGDS